MTVFCAATLRKYFLKLCGSKSDQIIMFTGLKGSQGAPGKRGAQGIKGETGDRGAPGFHWGLGGLFY